MQLTRRFTNHAGELFSEFDRLFRHTVGRPSSLPRNFSLYETEKSWMLRSDLPGLRKEDLKITVENGMLSIEGSSENELITTEINQSLRLPKDVRVEGIVARLEHGVLELDLPKSEPESLESIRIDVN